MNEKYGIIYTYIVNTLNGGDGLFNTDALMQILARIIVMFSAITVHEYAHGFVSYKLGDPTAKYSGRLSLNPISHIDPIGALCMIFFRFGWAKPVPINPMYYRNRKRDTAIVSLAGPVANVTLAFLSTILFSLYVCFLAPFVWAPLSSFISEIFMELAIVNISFAVFNLIPFPPLDGSKILGALLPHDKYMYLLQYERFGFPVLIILSVTGLLGKVLSILINPLYSMWWSLLNGLISLFS